MKKIIFLLVGLVFVFTSIYSAEFAYVGVKKCKMCHKGERKGNVFEKWEESLHSKAFESLKKKGEENNPSCLECHTTAFNKGGYKVGDSNAAKFEGVQCESCHGPGSEYKKMSVMKDKELSIKKGLVNPTEETCKQCHNEKDPSGKTFNYQEYLKKIDHKYSH